MVDQQTSLMEPHRQQLSRLCRKYHVRSLDVFGSVLTSRFAPRSDIDFLVEFEDLPPADYAQAWDGLRESLERLFARPIDLLTPRSLENPYLRRNVEATKRRLYPQ